MKFLDFVLLLFFYSKGISGELVLILEVFRTGARNNVYNFNKWNNNPNIEELTEVGMHQHYILGSQLRQKYVQEHKFLSPNFNESEFLLYATNFNRTITSVISHMLGFYPEKKEIINIKDEFIPNILNCGDFPEIEELMKGTFNTFPIHILQEKNDILMKALKCQGFKLMITQNKENNEILEKINQDYTETFSKLGKIMGIDKLNLDKLFKIMDGFSSDIFANKNIPSEIDDHLWPKLKFLYSIYWHVNYFEKERNKRFANTLIFDYITTVLNHKITNSSIYSKTKFIIFGGHDINLIHLMIGLNLTSSECIYENFLNSSDMTQFINCETFYPSFASNIIIELHKNESKLEYFIQISVNGVYKNLCMKHNIQCPYAEFQKRLTEYKLPNFEELCYSENETKKFIFNLDYTKKLLIYVISIIETSVLLIFSIIFFRMKIKNEEKEPLKQFFEMGAKQ